MDAKEVIVNSNKTVIEIKDEISIIEDINKNGILYHQTTEKNAKKIMDSRCLMFNLLEIHQSEKDFFPIDVAPFFISCLSYGKLEDFKSEGKDCHDHRIILEFENSSSGIRLI